MSPDRRDGGGDRRISVGRGGVEPPTSRFSGERSYRLSYLPLPVPEHRRATLTGLEPATSAVTGRRANQLRYRALLVVRAPNGVRTRATALKGRRPGPLDDGGSCSPGAQETIHADDGRPATGPATALPQPREAASSTELSVTFLHSRCSGPASTLCPSVHETSCPATLTVAVPFEVPAKATVLPSTFAL